MSLGETQEKHGQASSLSCGAFDFKNVTNYLFMQVKVDSD